MVSVRPQAPGSSAPGSGFGRHEQVPEIGRRANAFFSFLQGRSGTSSDLDLPTSGTELVPAVKLMSPPRKKPWKLQKPQSRHGKRQRCQCARTRRTLKKIGISTFSVLLLVISFHACQASFRIVKRDLRQKLASEGRQEVQPVGQMRYPSRAPQTGPPSKGHGRGNSRSRRKSTPGLVSTFVPKILPRWSIQ